jgi:hypothetical protein
MSFWMHMLHSSIARLGVLLGAHLALGLVVYCNGLRIYWYSNEVTIDRLILHDDLADARSTALCNTKLHILASWPVDRLDLHRRIVSIP